MKKLNRKELQSRYKAWREEPILYSFDPTTTHHCANCDHDFTGNFCPYCGQKHDMGSVTWKSIWQEFLNVWGMGGRSMLYSLWQLLWRPGYFISDYINGRRQVSFPPVKMMFLVSLFYVLMKNYVLPEKVFNPTTTPKSGDILQPLFDFISWMDVHQDWGMLVSSIALILPTWFIFRESPRNTRHTIPQGFFIQVMMSTMSMLFSIVSDVVGPFILVTCVWGIVATKQLFGYGWWGTIWRCGLLLVSMIFFALTVTGLFNIAVSLISGDYSEFEEHIMVALVFGVFLFYTLLVAYCFNNNLRQKYGVWGSIWRIAVFMLLPPILLFLTIFLYEGFTEGWDEMFND